jgi:hypothetical protein
MLYSEKGTEFTISHFRSRVSFTHLLLGLGVLNLMFGGIVLCSKAKTDLIKLVRPEAPSEWPKFGLTEPMYTPLYPNTLPIAVVSIGSPVAVPVPWHWYVNEPLVSMLFRVHLPPQKLCLMVLSHNLHKLFE